MKYLNLKIKKMFLLSFIFFINFSILYSKDTYQNINLKTKEDLEIENLEKNIKTLQKNIEELKKLKEKKNSKNLKVGLTLSGGGAKGYAHLGVLKVIEKENIKIDYISGTSIGALVGSLYSAGYTIKEIEKILDTLNLENFLEAGNNLSELPIDRKELLKKYSVYIKYDNNFNFSLPKGLKDSEYLYLQLKKIFRNHKNIEDLPIPMKIIATNLNTGKKVAFSKGDIAKFLTASMAVPAILDPVKIENNLYVDGMVTRNLPVQDAYDMGADVVVASDIGTDISYREKFNILSVLDQIIKIQSSYSNDISRKKASILISPDISKISAVDVSQKENLIKLGEDAAQKEINKINKLPKKNFSEETLKKEGLKIYSIREIKYSESFNETSLNTLEKAFSKVIDKKVSDKEIEDLVLKVYNSKYFSKLFYRVEKGTLYLDGENDEKNSVGVGFNYKSTYGSTINLGTDFQFNRKLKNKVHFNFTFGDYLGTDFSTYSYFGKNNKIGLFSKIGYGESPYFLYDGKNRMAKFLTEEFFLNLGLYNQLNDRTMISYGISSKLVNFDLATGDMTLKKLEYSGNINNSYFKVKYNTLDSIYVPMDGLKIDFIYNFSNSFGNLKSNVYGPFYSIRYYKPLIKNLSLLLGLDSAIIKGEEIRPNQYIKIGGSYTDIDKNEFEFYGFNFQEKSVKEFLSMNIGLRYKIFYSTYLTTKFNIATFGTDEVEKETLRMLKNYYKGMGIGILYDSKLGPIELFISNNTKRKSPIATFSIGYRLD